MEVIFKHNKNSSVDYNYDVIVNDRLVDSVDVNYEHKFTQAHLSLMQIHKKHNVPFDNMEIHFVGGNVSHHYPIDKLINMAKTLEEVT